MRHLAPQITTGSFYGTDATTIRDALHAILLDAIDTYAPAGNHPWQIIDAYTSGGTYKVLTVLGDIDIGGDCAGCFWQFRTDGTHSGLLGAFFGEWSAVSHSGTASVVSDLDGFVGQTNHWRLALNERELFFEVHDETPTGSVNNYYGKSFIHIGCSGRGSYIHPGHRGVARLTAPVSSGTLVTLPIDRNLSNRFDARRGGLTPGLPIWVISQTPYDEALRTPTVDVGPVVVAVDEDSVTVDTLANSYQVGDWVGVDPVAGFTATASWWTRTRHASTGVSEGGRLYSLSEMCDTNFPFTYTPMDLANPVVNARGYGGPWAGCRLGDGSRSNVGTRIAPPWAMSTLIYLWSVPRLDSSPYTRSPPDILVDEDQRRYIDKNNPTRYFWMTNVMSGDAVYAIPEATTDDPPTGLEGVLLDFPDLATPVAGSFPFALEAVNTLRYMEPADFQDAHPPYVRDILPAADSEIITDGALSFVVDDAESQVDVDSLNVDILVDGVLFPSVVDGAPATGVTVDNSVPPYVIVTVSYSWAYSIPITVHVTATDTFANALDTTWAYTTLDAPAAEITAIQFMPANDTFRGGAVFAAGGNAALYSLVHDRPLTALPDEWTVTGTASYSPKGMLLQGTALSDLQPASFVSDVAVEVLGPRTTKTPTTVAQVGSGALTVALVRDGNTLYARAEGGTAVRIGHTCTVRIVRDITRGWIFVDGTLLLRRTDLSTAGANWVLSATKARFANWTVRSGARIGDTLIDALDNRFGRVLGRVPAASLADVGPVQVTAFGIFGSLAADTDFEYTLPEPRTMSSTMRLYYPSLTDAKGKKRG